MKTSDSLLFGVLSAFLIFGQQTSYSSDEEHQHLEEAFVESTLRGISTLRKEVDRSGVVITGDRREAEARMVKELFTLWMLYEGPWSQGVSESGRSCFVSSVELARGFRLIKSMDDPLSIKDHEWTSGDPVGARFVKDGEWRHDAKGRVLYQQITEDFQKWIHSTNESVLVNLRMPLLLKMVGHAELVETRAIDALQFLQIKVRNESPRFEEKPEDHLPIICRFDPHQPDLKVTFKHEKTDVRTVLDALSKQTGLRYLVKIDHILIFDPTYEGESWRAIDPPARDK